MYVNSPPSFDLRCVRSSQLHSSNPFFRARHQTAGRFLKSGNGQSCDREVCRIKQLLPSRSTGASYFMKQSDSSGFTAMHESQCM
eukprot:2794199-Pleurochrysis_carterae.AAC.3